MERHSHAAGRSRSSQSQSPSHSAASASATSSHRKRKLPPSDDLAPPFPPSSTATFSADTRDGALTSNDDLESISARGGGAEDSDSEDESDVAVDDDEDEYDDSSIRNFTAARLENSGSVSAGAAAASVRNTKIKLDNSVKVETPEAGKDGGGAGAAGINSAAMVAGGAGGTVPGGTVKENKTVFTENIQNSGAYIAREESLKREEESGSLRFICVSNDGKDEHMVWLIGLKNIFSRQLPNMPKEYIVRLVMDRNHKSVMVIRRKQVVGGITYRPYVSQKFGEIAFCAITADEQVKGYGTRLMNHLKLHARDGDGLTHFLTYANFASSPKSLHLDILTSVLLTSMEMDGVVFDSHSAGQQAAMDVDTHLGIEKKTRKKGLKRKQSDAPLVRCIGVLLDGTKFDCSVDRGYSSNLEIGQGQLVIKEGDEGIKTILNASPPNATLQIGVECLSWSSAEDNCKDGSMLKDVATEREKCKENLKELAKFEASPEDGTSLVSKSERLDFTVNDGKFFEAAKKMKKGEVVVLTAKSQDGFPKLASDGEGDVPLDVTPSTLELVSWKTFADATDDNNKIVKGGEVCESPNDGTVEEEDDSDYDFDSHHLYGCATAEEGERMRYESYKRYKEGCRRIAEHEKEAKKAWKRDFGSWFSLYLDGKVSGNWRDSYRIDEDGFVATYRARAPPEALDGLGFSDLDEWDGDDI